MDYLKLVKAVRKFPRLSDAEVVSVLELMEPVEKVWNKELLTTRSLISQLPGLTHQQTGASCSLAQYLQKAGYAFERGEKGELLWIPTTELMDAVKVWAAYTGKPYLTIKR